MPNELSLGLPEKARAAEQSMNSELTQRLVNRFPVLYQDYRSPMTQTCMCWGFDHGDGWFEIIWQLSLAIEEELHYSVAARTLVPRQEIVFPFVNNFFYKLSPIPQDKQSRSALAQKISVSLGHRGESAAGFFGETGLQTISGRPFSTIITAGPRSFSSSGSRRSFAGRYTGFAVMQVKEKFGTLRFYCSGTDAIDRYIRLAERLSALTCEDCGKPGKANDSGWIRTQCDDCRDKRLSYMKDSSSVPSAITPRLLRLREAAFYLSSTTWFIEELVRTCKIRSRIIGKRRVIDIRDLDAWIEKQSGTASANAASSSADPPEPNAMEILTPEEVAKRLKVSVRWVYEKRRPRAKIRFLVSHWVVIYGLTGTKS